MRPGKMILLTSLALCLIAFQCLVVFSQNSSAPTEQDSQSTIEEVVGAGHKAAVEGDWATVESKFREALRLEPDEAQWRIQLLIALGQQKKWKDAFKEMDTVVIKQGVADWLLTINQKMADGQVAYINTNTFRDEQLGIQRYVKAVREKKKTDAVARDIGVKMDEFAKQRKLALIYDISKLKDKAFESGKTLDVTSEFISFYNARSKD